MSPNAVIGVPQEQAKPTRYLTLPDGETVIPLEYPCRQCGGAGSEPGHPGVCLACRGYKFELSAQGRALLAFLDKWQSRSRETPKPAPSLAEAVFSDAAAKAKEMKKANA